MKEKDCNKDILGIELNSVKGFFGVNGWACFGREKLCLLGIPKTHLSFSLFKFLHGFLCRVKPQVKDLHKRRDLGQGNS